MDRYHMVQSIEETTRKDKNTLDLIFTNQIDMIMKVEVTKTVLSDHDQIEITTNIESHKQRITQKMKRYQKQA